jgi:hypothetical protein
MIFIIPIILGAAALVTAGVGVSAGADGVSKLQKAQKIGKSAEQRYKKANKSLEKKFQATQKFAEEYGQLQINVKINTIGRFIKFISRIDQRIGQRLGQNSSQSHQRFLEGFEGFSAEQFKEYKAEVLDAQSLAVGGLKVVGVASAASQGTLGLIGLFGTASTGTAISGLSGVAAWNATLAWLGGGSLAAGGGGMALGTVVLGGITVGPALMIGGFVLGGEGKKSLTKAIEYAKEVDNKIAQLDKSKGFLGQVQRRIKELQYLVHSLNSRAIQSLTELESRANFNPHLEEDAAKFREVLLLIKASSEIMKLPILDDKGKLTQATENLQEKYRHLLKN